MEAIAEAVSLAEHLELDRNLVLDILPKTAVIAPAMSGKFSKIKSEDYSPEFPLYLMSKDLDLVDDAARESGAQLSAASVTKHLFGEALAAAGQQDMSAVAVQVRNLASRK